MLGLAHGRDTSMEGADWRAGDKKLLKGRDGLTQQTRKRLLRSVTVPFVWRGPTPRLQTSVNTGPRD